MNLEGFSKRGMELGDDPEQIRENQAIGGPQQELQAKYLKAVSSLALTLNELSSVGINISRDKVLYDIEREVNNQKLSSTEYEEEVKRNNDIVEKNESEAAELQASIDDVFGYDGMGRHR